MEEKQNDAIAINPRKTALLLLHWQNDIVHLDDKGGGTPMTERLKASHTIENMQAVLKATREKGMLVVYVNAAHRLGYPEIPAKCAPRWSGRRIHRSPGRIPVWCVRQTRRGLLDRAAGSET